MAASNRSPENRCQGCSQYSLHRGKSFRAFGTRFYDKLKRLNLRGSEKQTPDGAIKRGPGNRSQGRLLHSPRQGKSFMGVWKARPTKKRELARAGIPTQDSVIKPSPWKSFPIAFSGLTSSELVVWTRLERIWTGQETNPSWRQRAETLEIVLLGVFSTCPIAESFERANKTCKFAREQKRYRKWQQEAYMKHGRATKLGMLARGTFQVGHVCV